MRYRRVLSICTAVLVPLGVRAQTVRPSDAPGITLREAVDSALRRNLDLRIVRTLIDSARAESRIARALPNPSYAVIPNTPMQYAATIALDIGPQRLFRTRASDLGARAVRADVEDGARQVVFAVRKAYYDVLLADARRSIVGARRAIMRQLVAADSARVRAGDLPERSLIRSGVELVRADADVARTAVDAQTTRLTLQAVMGSTSPDTALRVSGDLSYRELAVDSGAAIETALARRPDVAASRTREQQSAATERLAASVVVPVPQLAYVRQYGAPYESGRYFALGIGVEVPILNQYGGQRERAAAGREAAGYARRRVEAQVVREVRASMAEFRAQRALVRQYESGVIAKLGQNVDATRYAYTRGATSLLEVLDALRAQQDVLTDYYTALHDYWVAVSALQAAQGVTTND
jgi:cobalt-zinc-cadmium efflux system outer membrane protein